MHLLFIPCPCISSLYLATNIIRTYFVSFCFLIQLQMLLDIPTSMPLSEVSLPLPSSEELWCAPTAAEWSALLPSSPPTPNFQEAFTSLFPTSQFPDHVPHDHSQIPSTHPPTTAAHAQHRYSEFGGYVTISAILSAILNSYRIQNLPPVSIDWRGFDYALDTWQRSWNADPKSHSTGPSSPFGAMAFNASAIYRATSIRRVKDYSKYSPFTRFFRDVLITYWNWHFLLFYLRILAPPPNRHENFIPLACSLSLPSLFLPHFLDSSLQFRNLSHPSE